MKEADCNHADQGPTAATALVIVGHGSRDPRSTGEFELLVERYAARRPDLRVSCGYIELCEPSLADALDEAAREAPRVIVLPLFLFRAGHIKNDVPLLLNRARDRHPRVSFHAAEPLGVHPLMIQILRERVIEARPAGKPIERIAIIVVNRGSSDADANGEFSKLVRIYQEGEKYAAVFACSIGITRPRLEETLDLAARLRVECIVVAPYFLFSGELMCRIEAKLNDFARQYGWVTAVRAPHIGVHEALFQILEERIYQAVEGGAPLPCDTCSYRAEATELARRSDGLRALLWSVRHAFTHTQAMPHVHAHKPIRKHVLVCGNTECVNRGSIPLINALRRRVRGAGQETNIRVTRTHCMGRCGEGPTVAVYPDGVWYRGVDARDAEELFREHLMSDRLVPRLVDQIMQ